MKRELVSDIDRLRLAIDNWGLALVNEMQLLREAIVAINIDRKTENCSEIPNNCECEPRKEQNFCGKCRYLYRDFKYGLSCYRLMDNEPCKYEERKTEPTSSKMEQVDEPQIDNLATAIANNAYCKTCKHLFDEDCDCDVVFTGYEPKDEPQTERSE